MPPEVGMLVDAAAGYIKHWTQQELAKITSSSPICIPLHDGYKIGTYTLTVNKNKTCRVEDINREFTHTFDNKISAILYTVYSIKNNLTTANEILVLDKEINKNYTDILAMQSRLNRAKAKKDYETVDIRQARIEFAENQLESARDKISKIHKRAKYFKVWE
jgi:hypothetical protein